MSIIISPILWLNKLRLDETKYLPQRHTAQIRKTPKFRATIRHCLLSFSYPQLCTELALPADLHLGNSHFLSITYFSHFLP